MPVKVLESAARLGHHAARSRGVKRVCVGAVCEGAAHAEFRGDKDVALVLWPAARHELSVRTDRTTRDYARNPRGASVRVRETLSTPDPRARSEM